MNIYIKTMAEDDDKEVVAQACLSIADIMKDYGYIAIQNCGCQFHKKSYFTVFNLLSTLGLKALFRRFTTPCRCDIATAEGESSLPAARR